MGLKSAALKMLLSAFWPNPAGENVNIVNVNNHNNFQTKQKKPSTPKPPTVTHFSSIPIHKGYSLLAGVSMSYTSLYLYLTYLAHVLSKNTRWSLWKHDNAQKSPQDSEDAITQGLLVAIQKNYTSHVNPMDFFTPLTKFLKDLEKEEQQLERYLKVVRMVKRLRLSKFFSIDEKIFQDAPSRLDRLAYLKNLFLNWAASYKLNSQTSEFSTNLNTSGIKKAVAK